MTGIKDNPPPLPAPRRIDCGIMFFSAEDYRAGEAAAFERGKAAMQGEIDKARGTAEYWKAEHLAGNAVIDELRAKLKALEEQKPVAYLQPATVDSFVVAGQYETCGPNDYAAIPVYTTAGAKP